MAKEIDEKEESLSYDFLHGRRVGFNAGLTLGMIIGAFVSGIIFSLLVL